MIKRPEDEKNLENTVVLAAMGLGQIQSGFGLGLV